MKFLYKYPQAAFPYARAGRGEPPARPAGAGVRAARHRRLRRRPLLRRRRRVRQGGCRRHPDPRSPSSNRGPDAAAIARAADALVPQHLVVADGGRASALASAPVARRRRSCSTSRTYGRALAALRAASRRCSSPRTRPTPSGSSAQPNGPRYVKDAFHDYVVDGARDAVNPGATGHQGGGALRARRAGRRHRRRCGCGSTIARRDSPAPSLGDALRRRSFAHAAARSRRVLRHGHPGRPVGRRQERRAAGVRRAALVEAVLPLRRQATGSTAIRRSRRRRPERAARPQPRVDASLQRRRHLDAGQVGVPVVRGLGPGVPLRAAGARRLRTSRRSS